MLLLRVGMGARLSGLEPQSRVRARVRRLGTHGIVVVKGLTRLTRVRRRCTRCSLRKLAHARIATRMMIRRVLSLVQVLII